MTCKAKTCQCQTLAMTCKTETCHCQTLAMTCKAETCYCQTLVTTCKAGWLMSVSNRWSWHARLRHVSIKHGHDMQYWDMSVSNSGHTHARWRQTTCKMKRQDTLDEKAYDASFIVILLPFITISLTYQERGSIYWHFYNVHVITQNAKMHYKW